MGKNLSLRILDHQPLGISGLQPDGADKGNKRGGIDGQGLSLCTCLLNEFHGRRTTREAGVQDGSFLIGKPAAEHGLSKRFAAAA